MKFKSIYFRDLVLYREQASYIEKEIIKSVQITDLINISTKSKLL